MKKLLLLIALVGFFAFSMTSCGGKQEKAENEEEGYNEYETAEDGQTAKGTEQATEQASPDALIKEGQTLVDQADCKTCHHATNKLIGPPHADVAKKYDFTEANVTYLAEKIKTGGSGVWGEIPMTPHPGVSDEDAKKMAMYVLSLDGEKPNL